MPTEALLMICTDKLAHWSATSAHAAHAMLFVHFIWANKDGLGRPIGRSSLVLTKREVFSIAQSHGCRVYYSKIEFSGEESNQGEEKILPVAATCQCSSPNWNEIGGCPKSWSSGHFKLFLSSFSGVAGARWFRAPALISFLLSE